MRKTCIAELKINLMDPHQTLNKKYTVSGFFHNLWEIVSKQLYDN